MVGLAPVRIILRRSPITSAAGRRPIRIVLWCVSIIFRRRWRTIATTSLFAPLRRRTVIRPISSGIGVTTTASVTLARWTAISGAVIVACLLRRPAMTRRLLLALISASAPPILRAIHRLPIHRIGPYALLPIDHRARQDHRRLPSRRLANSAPCGSADFDKVAAD